MHRIAVATTLSIAMIAAAGCGSGNDEDQIKSTFSQAASALKDGDGKQFCDALTPAAAESVGKNGKQATGAAGCAEVVTNLMNATKAISAGDWAKFCDAIGPDAAAQIAKSGKGASCASAAATVGATPAGKQAFAAIAKQLEDSLGKVTKGELQDIKIDGDKATAKLSTEGSGGKPVNFEKVDGGWKIAADAVGGSQGSTAPLNQ